MSVNSSLSASRRSDQILQPQRAAADRIMLSMMVFLLAVCFGVAYFTSTWMLTLVVAVPALLVPWAIYKGAPGSLASRLSIACALMVFSALTIQQSQGMIESHFGIFTLLAFLLYYRDWRPIVAAAGLIAVHHVVFGYLQATDSVGITVLEGDVHVTTIILHAAYVVFEAAMLIFMATILRREAVESALVAELSGQISEGDFSPRGPAVSASELPLLYKVSQMQKSLQSTLQDIVGVMTAVAQGHLDRRVTVEARGDLGALKENINQSIQVQQSVFQDITHVMQGVAKGNFGLRVTAEAKGELDGLKQSINQSMAAQQIVFQDITHVMQGVADGNLQRRVSAQAMGDLELLKQNINQSLDALRGAMTTINQNARQVATASDEASNAIGQISDGARHQTDAISHVSSAVRQTVASVADVSQNTELASQKSRQSFALVRASMEKMDEMVKVVNNIATNSEKINKITDVIEKIANKTNLLSLNAAIEAARAGEHGKGFAVVAEEVGKLALNSAESSQEIATLVKQAVEEARSAVTAVMDVSQDMSGIERETQATDEMLQRIVAALDQQSAAVDQINGNLNNLDQIARSNSSASEEIAATVVELSKIADATRREVQRFSV
ncbi:methyl-accepting chemotaxis protein [Limnohabitans radicicola]|uniref:Methyl-accepting chemotaxis protein n=1 Tax=Limnohabitans radicicola TaxID=2771427 RepID=A0A927ILE8_9BURK|nr:methyl-accepting chemotaxis protein [Limnohabitans radicicola]MBD8050648.1 methyl-accepting chemotaxis protein [Limnohabitans radicicola]